MPNAHPRFFRSSFFQDGYDGGYGDEDEDGMEGGWQDEQQRRASGEALASMPPQKRNEGAEDKGHAGMLSVAINTLLMAVVSVSSLCLEGGPWWGLAP